MIPREMKESFDHYVNYGVPPGDFLEAVLSNNLMDAVGRADDNNRYLLHEICSYIYNEMPISSHGSREIVNKWMADGQRRYQSLMNEQQKDKLS